MKVSVIGAGVVGMMQAYFLARAGHDVTVIDAKPGVGQGTSRANAAQISPNISLSFAGPDLLNPIELAAILRGHRVPKVAASVLDPRVLSQNMSWSLQLLKGSLPKNVARAVHEMMRLNAHAKQKWEQLLLAHPDLGPKMAFRPAGKLQVFEDASAFEAACQNVPKYRAMGAVQSVLDADEAHNVPFVQKVTQSCVGGIHTEDMVGDPYKFCQAMQDMLVEQYNVTFLLGYAFRDITAQGEECEVVHVAHVQTRDRVDVPTQAMVICAGTASRDICKAIHIDPPSLQHIYGGVLTFDARGIDPADLPSVSITQKSAGQVFCTLTDDQGQHRFRLSGGAILGADEAWAARLRTALLDRAYEVLPALKDKEYEWVFGARHCSPNQVAILERTQEYQNVFLNVGHAGLGWTQSPGAADIITSMIGVSY